jgi:acetyltransferase-like isoleucine patch superfamily enzyme
MLSKILISLDRKYNSLLECAKLREIYKNSNISKSSKIAKAFKGTNLKNIIIEDYVYIGPNAFFSSFDKIIIKRGTIIGPNVIIHTANHNYADNIKSIPYDRKLIKKSVIIEENNWIGDRVIILPGVRIGEGCIIAAGSVVTKSFQSFSIIGGNPAKLIRQRQNIEDYMENKKLDHVYMKLKK